MKVFLWAGVLGGSIGAVACGGIAVFDDGVGGDAGTTGTSIATTNTTRSATASTRASSVQNTANTMSSGSPDIRASIVSMDLFGNCFGGVDPDPILGSVTIQYDNVGFGDGFASIVDAQIQFSNPMEAWSFGLAFQPTSSGLVEAGSTNVVQHDKISTGVDNSFVCNLCGAPATIIVSLDNGTAASIGQQFPCAF